MHEGEKPDRRERREFSRVNTWVPFEYRRVPKEEWGNLRSRFLGPATTREAPGPHESGNQPLVEYLKKLDMKLDLLIHMLAIQQEGFHDLPCRAVNISGGGIGFPTGEELTVGDVLEIKMLLSHPHPVAVYVYGKVAKCMRTGEGFYAGARFVWMDETVRDEIVRFVFERERELLREKRGNQEDSWSPSSE